MRRIVIFTMILTLIFSMTGYAAHSEPDKKAAESSSSNAVIDITQAEKCPRKKETKQLRKGHLRKKQHSRLPMKPVQKRCQ